MRGEICMKISDKMEAALNEQIKNELYSAYLYLSMSAYSESKNFKGFAHWLKLQAKEELEHAMKIYDFIFERGGKAVLKAIDEPPKEWDSFLDLFKNVYEHENKVTDMINNLLKMAREENDYATEVFLHWFIDEQVEEESSADEIVQKLTLAGDQINALMLIDRALAERQ